ncbi:MAG: ATP-binding protein, partial [Muribaculaceae bacterium]|nr:ATP-binding protein [Muribaculaceae bacterium]
SNPMPGEISLAHNGILYLDELPEFGRQVLEVMRQPLEDHSISISRAKYAVEYPASFMLVASMNPCPCGYYTHPTRQCTCAPGAVQRYLNRISGPLLDRIDIQIEVAPVEFDDMTSTVDAEPSRDIRARVEAAREIQRVRFANYPEVHCNAQMNSKLIKRYATPDEAGLKRLREAIERMGMSARAYDRILKVARTIADLSNIDKPIEEAVNAPILSSHISEAISYRNLDRSSWGTTTLA